MMFATIDEISQPAVPGRRGFLGSMLGIAATAALPKPTPLANAYRHLVACQRRVLGCSALPNHPYPDCRPKESALRDACNAEARASSDLARLVAEAAGFDWTTERLADDREERPQAPLAVHREGNLIFALLICESGSIGSSLDLPGGPTSSGYALRPVVIGLRDGGRHMGDF